MLRTMLLTDMDMIQTSGTVVLQRMRAKQASVASDGESLLARDILLSISSEKPGEAPLIVACPMGRYYHAAPLMPDATAQAPVAVGEIERWRDGLSVSETDVAVQGARRSDMLLVDPRPDGAVRLNFGQSGGLETTALFWNGARDAFVSLAPFTQEGRSDSGAMFRVSGESFITDRAFQNWLYPVIDGKPVVIEFQGGAKP